MVVRTATMLCAAVLLAACAATHQLAGGSTLPTPIPWLPLEAGPPVFPTPPPVVIPFGTPSCHAGDVVISYRGTVGIGGGVVGTGIWLGNRTAGACLLSGLPAIRVLNARGQQIAITSEPITRLPATAVLLAAHTEDVASSNGEPGTAALSLEWQTFDESTQSCPNQAPPASAIVVRLPGDSTELTVPVGKDVRPLAPCNSRIQVSPFQGFAPAPPPVPHRLVATISAPAQVRAGERLGYTVTLRNISSEPVRFGAVCPSYFESGGMGHQLLAKEGYALNCHAVGAIPPGGTVTFGMELAVLPSAAPGDNTFGWELAPDFDADTAARASIRVVP